MVQPVVRDGWYSCPMCKKHIQRIEPGSVIYNTPFRCRACRVDWYPTIYMGQEITGDIPPIHTADK